MIPNTKRSKCVRIACIFQLATFAIEAHAACGGESGSPWVNDRKRNSKPGGFVADGAVVDEEAFIAPTASVCGSAIVQGYSKINGRSVIQDQAIVQSAQIGGDAIIYGDAKIESGAIVNGNAQIGGDAVVKNGAIVGGFTRRTTGILGPGVYRDKQPQAEIDAINRAAYVRDSTQNARSEYESKKASARDEDAYYIAAAYEYTATYMNGFSEDVQRQHLKTMSIHYCFGGIFYSWNPVPYQKFSDLVLERTKYVDYKGFNGKWLDRDGVYGPLKFVGLKVQLGKMANDECLLGEDAGYDVTYDNYSH